MLNIDYDNLIIITSDLEDFPRIKELIIQMDNAHYCWIDNNWDYFLDAHYGMCISVYYYLEISDDVLQFNNKQAMDLFILNFL